MLKLCRAGTTIEEDLTRRIRALQSQKAREGSLAPALAVEEALLAHALYGEWNFNVVVGYIRKSLNLEVDELEEGLRAALQLCMVVDAEKGIRAVSADVLAEQLRRDSLEPPTVMKGQRSCVRTGGLTCISPNTSHGDRLSSLLEAIPAVS